MEKWLDNPDLLEADTDAEYAAVIEIDLAEVTEPVVCAPNDPDDARLLSQVAGDEVNEVLARLGAKSASTAGACV